MLLDCHHGILGPPDPEKLKEILENAENNFRIPRYEGESDEDYAARAIKIVRLSEEVPKLFADGTWDTGSVVDAITIGLASIIATNYKSQDNKTIDPIVMTLLEDRIHYFRQVEGQTSPDEVSDETVLDMISKFRLFDRPTGGGEESEKIRYARSVLKTLRTVESAVIASDATEFDSIEALCIELSVILGKSPLPKDLIKSLVERIIDNVSDIRGNDEEDIQGT